MLTDSEYMKIARVARKHADCKGRHVGAVLVLANGGLVIGANGSPAGHLRCEDGGCHRCANPEQYPRGVGYDVCTCVHAEEACVAAGAKSGLAVDGSRMFSTMRPCRECTKLMINAGVKGVWYEDDWIPQNEQQAQAYLELQSAFPLGVNQVVTRALTLPVMSAGAPSDTAWSN